MQSSYQFHYGGQAAAAKGASPTKSTAKADGAQSAAAQSSMFVPKVDWSSSGNARQGPAAASNNSSQSKNAIAYGFGGSSVGFGGAQPSFGGAPSQASQPSFGGPPAAQKNSSFGSRAQPSFGVPAAASNQSSAVGLTLGSSHSQSRASAAPSFGGASGVSSMGSAIGNRPTGTGATFGGPAAGASAAASASRDSASGLGFGFSASSWQVQETGEHVTNCTSVKEYAYFEDRNQRFRPQMEDTHCIVDKVIPSDPSSGLFAIFDGHGGRQVSDYCAERFPNEVKKELMRNPADLNQPLTDIFNKVNGELRLLDSDGCGSTACVAIVRKEGANNILYVANVGDTRAVVSKSGTAERLSIDDKCDNPEENLRVKSGGGIILDNRLGGVLAVTRAFGDHALTRVGLIATPHTVKYTIKPFDKYLVIASDGVWDELTDQDAIDLCHDDLSTKKIAQAIVRTALQRGSKDNISVIVIRFNGSTGAMY